jgi:hypothetical protein
MALISTILSGYAIAIEVVPEDYSHHPSITATGVDVLGEETPCGFI